MNNRQLFLNHLAQTSPAPLALEIVRSEGVYLYDSDDKKYLDVIAGISVSVLGHRHPAVVNAIKNQVDLYMHTLVYGEFVLSPQIKLVSLLTSLLPENLSSVYLVNSGSEATEGAMKLAKKYTGRSEIISAKFAYHGSTQGAASLMFPTTFTEAFFPLLPHINHIDFNCLSCLDRITNKTAAVILETVQAEFGVRLPHGDFLKQVADRCKSTGTLLILDEIQTGMGRTGSLFAFSQYDVIPDISTWAKSMGGGMPIGCVMGKAAIMDAAGPSTIGGTYPGNPVCAAAALATIEYMEEMNINELGVQVGIKVNDFFERLKSKFPDTIKAIHGLGAMLAIELVDQNGNPAADLTKKVLHFANENGLILISAGVNGNYIRILSPLVISDAHLFKGFEIIENAFNALL